MANVKNKSDKIENKSAKLKTKRKTSIFFLVQYNVK
jgi:hypothetical protein